MDEVSEIETAIDSLPPDEFRSLAEWVRDRDQEHWDRQLDADAAAGKLNFLLAEAEAESDWVLQDWPTSS